MSRSPSCVPTSAQPEKERRWESLYAAARGALATDATETAVPMLEQLAAERPDYADVTQLLERVRPDAIAPAARSGASGAASPVSPTGPTPPPGPGRPSPPTPGDDAPATPAPAVVPASRPDRRLLIGGGVAAVVLVSALGFALWRGQSPTSTPTSGSSVSSTAGGSPTTVDGVTTVDLPTTGTPTGALVLPFAVDGDYFSAAGSDQIGPWGDLKDVLRLPGGNRVVTVSQAGRVRMTLTDTGGSTLVDLGEFDSRVEANRGTRFAYVDGADGHLSVRDTAGTEVAALQGVGPEAKVVGFAGPAVFFTDDGSTFRWDTTTRRATEWRQAEMVSFNDSTRTAVGQSSTGCFACSRSTPRRRRRGPSTARASSSGASRVTGATPSPGGTRPGPRRAG